MATKEAKKIAESYFVRIGDGHDNAVRRPGKEIEEADYIDRELRRMINKANKNGDCIISGTTGYYRPIPGNVTDELEYKEYLNGEDSRVHDLIVKKNLMVTTFEGWRKEGKRAV